MLQGSPYVVVHIWWHPPARHLTTVRGDWGHHFRGQSAFAAWTDVFMCRFSEQAATWFERTGCSDGEMPAAKEMTGRRVKTGWHPSLRVR